MPTDALAAVAEELYALLPDEFTAARNDRAREVRGDDRELASRIQELRRPAPAAWLVNQLVRHRADQLDGILDLGAELREAQDELDAAALSRLTKQRRQLVAALARDAGGLAEELGNPVRDPVLDEVAQTLQAAMSDAAAADAVRSGRLVRALEAVGLEVDVDGAVAGGPALAASTSARTAATGSRGRAPEASESAEATEASAAADAAALKVRERAERAAREAEQRAEAAAAALEELDGRVDEHRKRIADLTSERDELEERLRAVESELADAERELRPVARERDRAARASEEARDAADEARDALG